jgi:hypothetical protein
MELFMAGLRGWDSEIRRKLMGYSYNQRAGRKFYNGC